MALTVRVDDYYNNDENGLWSWYLRNIRSGDFEELTKNELKYTLLKRFLNSNIYNNKNIRNFNKNQRFLFISIPDKVHSDISILETFLKDYFHLEDLHNIRIQKLTKDQCYNHENHYLLIDTMNNFNDPTFLNYVDPKRYNKFNNDLDQIDNTNSVPSNIINKDFLPTNSATISEEEEEEEEDDDEESSIVLNFSRAASHHIRHTNQESQIKEPISDVQESVNHLPLNHVFTPPDSETMSINSYYNDNDRDISKHSLIRMVVSKDTEVEKRNYSEEEEEEEEEMVGDDNSFVSSISDTSYLSSYSDMSLESSTSSHYSILPSISIYDKGGNFKLVLQSCLLYKENKEILTAIRQSNNAVDVASVDDDWILYDSQFNMNNLTILTLKELFEFGHDIPKILFYSMVIVNSSIQKIRTTNDIENGNNNSTDYSERIDKLSGSNNDELDINDESNNDLRQENPKLLYDDTEEPQMCAPERMVSNTTTVGHRSIRTINTMGEWAYRKKSNITFGNGGSEVGDSSPKNFQDDPNEDKDIEKRNNIARWKSVPNHNNNSNNNDDDDNNSSSNSSGSNNPDSKLSSSHQTAVKNRFNRSNYKKGKYDDGVIHSGGKRWNLKIKKFKRPSDTKKYNDDKICMIM